MSLTTFEIIEPVEPISKEVIPTARVDYVPREWKSEPDGPNDRPVDIWINGNWIPAFFSDIKKGDFFLDVKMGDIGSDRCFFASSNIHRSVSNVTKWTSFVVQGVEIVQAPAIKDINTAPATKPLELK